MQSLNGSNTEHQEKIEKYDEADQNTQEALKRLKLELNPDSLSPTLRKIQPLLASFVNSEQRSQNSIQLPIPNEDVTALIDANNQLVIRDNKTNQIIPSISIWLKQRNL